MKEIFVDEVVNPWRGSRCLVYLYDEHYFYKDEYENYEINHYICNIDEDYIEGLADIFF